MNYKFIDSKILEVFIECDTQSFPLKCEDMLICYGYKVLTYAALREKSREIFELCTALSEDAFTDSINKIIAYNQKIPKGRIRFSLMHELGHIVLKHSGDSEQNEHEANYFASHILAPRIAVYYAKCKDAKDIHKTFGLTYEAGGYAYDDYEKWFKQVRRKGNKISAIDMGIYKHFYHSLQGKFVWGRKDCVCCNKLMYNTTSDKCDTCDSDYDYDDKPYSRIVKHYYAGCDDINFVIAESRWLYGFVDNPSYF